MTGKSCPICGGSMDGKRSSARTCGGSCRAELSRLERILHGREADGVPSIKVWLERRRYKRPLGGIRPNP